MVNVIEIQSIREVFSFLDPETHLFLDIDYTLFSSPHPFGSERWERFMAAHFISEGVPEEEAVARACELWKAVQTVSDIEFAEENMFEVFEALREGGWPVFAITARSQDFNQVTEKQLASLGMRFSSHTAEYCFTENYIVFSNGVFYCGNAKKGEVLKTYADVHSPRRIVMVDDNRTHLEIAAKILDIPFVGLRYGRLDPAKANYKPDEVTVLLGKIFNHPEACKFLRKALAK